ncbi:hypothetical protein HZA57_02695, partial [Candidatus Poribacteria bacterium]|nr:hypothetical protein [Candidatus Poribacteria bacterium]
MNRIATLTLLAGSLLMATAGFGEDSPTSGTLGSRTIAELSGEPVPMTMGDVVLATLAQNLDVQIRKKDRDIAGREVLKQYGIYDPTLDASAVRTRIDEQTRSIPDPATGASFSPDEIQQS